MNKLLVILLTWSLLACGSRSSEISTSTDLSSLHAKFNYYHSHAPRGWESSEGCDSLLFVSLLHVGLGEPGPIDEAETMPGRWFRLPGSDAKACSSDISRDMFMGLFLYIWQFQRLDLAESIWTYGDTHGWVMGEERKPPDNRTVLSPVMIGLLAHVIHGLGGADHPQRHIPPVYSTSPGYVSHLSLLAILLRGQINGSLSQYELGTLTQIRTHMSLNPLVHALLHKYTDGDQAEATRLLLEIWPSSRLPNTSDWSEAWRLQRSDGDTGLRTPPQSSSFQSHSGGDFLFVTAFLLGRFRNAP